MTPSCQGQPLEGGADDYGRHMAAVTQKSVLSSVPAQLFIAGEWRDSLSQTTFPVEDPATGSVLLNVANGTVADGAAALDAAVAAQADWAATAPRARGEILRRAFEML